jgi:hypothetical protein
MPARTKHRKPPALGTIWAATARIQIIDQSTWKWRTLGECTDAPNPIVALAKKIAQQPEYKGATLWVTGTVTERQIIKTPHTEVTRPT